MGLISKTNNFVHAQHTFFCKFLCCCFARLQHETSGTSSYTFNRGNVVHVLVLFFHCRLFSPCILLVTASYFVTAATKFSCCSSNQEMSTFYYISRSRSLSLFFSLSFAALPPTFSSPLSFSCSIFQICGHDN